jgi:hypothetical protein
MSYSFNFRAATKASAREKAKVEFDTIVAQQPVHVQDREIALEALDLYLGVLMDDDTRDIQVSCHGSLGYDWQPDVDAAAVPLTHASVGLAVYHVSKEAAE